MNLESQLQVRLLLVAPERLPALRLFRRNIGSATLRGFKVQFAIPGQCDLYGITRGGGHLEIELKSASGSLKPDQRIWKSWCEEWRVPHVVLHAEKRETIEETVDRWCLELRDLLLSP